MVLYIFDMQQQRNLPIDMSYGMPSKDSSSLLQVNMFISNIQEMTFIRHISLETP